MVALSRCSDERQMFSAGRFKSHSAHTELNSAAVRFGAHRIWLYTFSVWCVRIFKLNRSPITVLMIQNLINRYGSECQNILQFFSLRYILYRWSIIEIHFQLSVHSHTRFTNGVTKRCLFENINFVKFLSSPLPVDQGALIMIIIFSVCLC